eukprot:364536-Chlamydomonas_euryale.AAC.16
MCAFVRACVHAIGHVWGPAHCRTSRFACQNSASTACAAWLHSSTRSLPLKPSVRCAIHVTAPTPPLPSSVHAHARAHVHAARRSHDKQCEPDGVGTRRRKDSAVHAPMRMSVRLERRYALNAVARHR